MSSSPSSELAPWRWEKAGLFGVRRFSTSLSEPVLEASLWLVKGVGRGLGLGPGSSSESRSRDSGESGGSGIPGEVVGPQLEKDVSGGFDGVRPPGDGGNSRAGSGEVLLVAATNSLPWSGEARSGSSEEEGRLEAARPRFP